MFNYTLTQTPNDVALLELAMQVSNGEFNLALQNGTAPYFIQLLNWYLDDESILLPIEGEVDTFGALRIETRVRPWLEAQFRDYISPEVNDNSSTTLSVPLTDLTPYNYNNSAENESDSDESVGDPETWVNYDGSDEDSLRETDMSNSN